MYRRLALLLALGTQPAFAVAAGPAWQAIEKTQTYAISGSSGAELYASIGMNGPVIGGGRVRAIAYTDFKLTWQRVYENPDGACVLAAARPKLIITYRVPKPAGPLPAPVKASWERFFNGIIIHERHHGDIIRAMVRKIEKESIGIRFENDPKCQKVRAELTRRLGAISRAERQENVDFDRKEMGNGGTVHQLILALVNGP
jgi:predicted secreted Zn-dependent protease